MTSPLSRRTVLTTTAATAATMALGASTAPGAHAVPTLPSGTSKDKVLVIGMDGLRHDRIDAANAPHLKAMMSEGTYGTSLLYAGPMAATSSGPGWSTISTGVWPDKHGVKDNTFVGKRYDRYPGFLARLARIRPALATYAAVDWKPLDTQGTVTPGADVKLVLDGDADGYTGHDATIAGDAETIIRDQNPDVLFVYFGQSDIVGHDSGAGSQAYLDQIAVQDAYLGRLRAAIKARPSRATERWTVIVTTDHGHLDAGGHGGSAIEERRTFVLATGPGIAAGARPIDTRLVDVVPTVFKQLGIPVDPAWGLDGKPVQERTTDPFDALTLSARTDEAGIPSTVLGYTHTPPSGWSVINNAMGGGGMTEWRGWAFATEFWSRTQRDQWRELNVRARGVFAVADSDEWADRSFSGTYDSTLVTPAYDVTGSAKVRLDFTTLYRQEGSQTAQVLVSFNGNTPAVVKSYTSDVVSQPQSLTVGVPSGATTVHFRFRYTGSNNWFWVIDGVRISHS
ncbi:alkaline phosphatase family protein [Streptomyces bicolor]|uniref:alkaline phosphatase family protein n=1 Tax=Streptomyces bicolor TaxID=66874 RepID=UPI0004E0FD04|nr:alkaline phosphatase family protein [Streptomyces bicolor]